MNILRRTCCERRRTTSMIYKCHQISYIFDPVRWLMPQLACPAFTPVPPTGRDRRAFSIFVLSAGVQRGAPPMSFLLHSYPTAASSALTLCFCSVRSLFLRFPARSGVFEFFEECGGACGRCSAWRGCTPTARRRQAAAAPGAPGAAAAAAGRRLPPPPPPPQWEARVCRRGSGARDGGSVRGRAAAARPEPRYDRHDRDGTLD